MQISIRLLQENELPLANRIFQIAFSKLIGDSSTASYGSDINYMNRWYTDPKATFAAEIDSQLVGVNIATHLGSLGILGPLVVHPDFWNQGIGKKLMEPVMDCFHGWGITQIGLFTSTKTPKNLSFYQNFGFYSGFLIALMSKQIQFYEGNFRALMYSQLRDYERVKCLKACSELTDTIYTGLDITREICAINSRKMGDTILLWDDSRLLGFAVCHCGVNTEAGRNVCYIKFGIVRLGIKTEQWFEQLLQECEKFATMNGLSSLVFGVSTARCQIYQKIIALGFRIYRLGVAMHKPNNPIYNHADVFVIDDWR